MSYLFHKSNTTPKRLKLLTSSKKGDLVQRGSSLHIERQGEGIYKIEPQKGSIKEVGVILEIIKYPFNESPSSNIYKVFWFKNAEIEEISYYDLVFPL